MYELSVDGWEGANLIGNMAIIDAVENTSIRVWGSTMIPYLYREKEDLGEYYYNSITKVKPGITGYWQVNGRNDVDFEERAYMDTYYIERRGIVMDLKIILKTFLKIFKKEGAV